VSDTFFNLFAGEYIDDGECALGDQLVARACLNVQSRKVSKKRRILVDIWSSLLL